MISIRDNCSTYDPCGTYGYCRDNSKDEWTCICKFWWKGTLCNELSSGGKQVIALGIITGFLVALFYGLGLFRWIGKKRQEAVNYKNTLTIETVKRKSCTICIIATNSSRRMMTWITVISTFVLGTIAIIIRWIILKSIHNEIIYKFNNNQSLFYNRPSICRIIYMREEFNMFTFPVACLLILLFVVITKRESHRKNRVCKGYFGLPIPLDFFARIKRTFAAITFAIFADELSNLANQFINGNRSSIDEGIIVTYVFLIIKVFVIGFRCYPILAAVYIDTRFTLILATLYAWFDFSITIAFNGVCRNDYYSTNDDYNKTYGSGTITYLTYYGTGSKLIFFQLFSDIPRYLFLSYVSIKLPILLFKRIRSRKLRVKPLTREQEYLLHSSLPNSAESRYVKNLFRLTNTEDVSMNRFARLCRSIYAWRNDFRFSSRVLCVYASIFFLLFFLTLQACVQVPPFLDTLRIKLQKFINLLMMFIIHGDFSLQQIEDSSSDFPIPDLVRPYLIAVFTALIVIFIQLLVLLVSIRRNLLQVFHGDNSEIPRRISSQSVDYAYENIHFAGYLIGYVLWGYILVAFFVMIIGIIIDIVITYGMVRFIESILKKIIPPLLFAIFQVYMNKILAQYVFLQQGGDVLSINHRRILMVHLYFNFFLDAFLGLISSIIRVLTGMIGGMIYMCRLDCSSMGRKLETLEAGFSAYCGFIHMECAHRHPILLYFTSVLLREHLYGISTTRWSKARRKWYLAFFLLNNPTFIYRRKGFLVGSPMNEKMIMLIRRKKSENSVC
ncbi:unnamed protein product [Rotaria sp. Silwood2]|nr:unnamed protein product [Rotaria sp. Silwood2]CAF2639183.1 unnamed protein product [Rotaria sp. Silwood2]CAF3124698.1 unnamed protein product [Rotaria sp. Silwood2]CAF3983565.1 unnamed protein product [Rotaria sp. Silwood2]CAF4021393.1 unnamed protein product [Rotaria sp. Silwood2]